MLNLCPPARLFSSRCVLCERQHNNCNVHSLEDEFMKKHFKSKQALREERQLRFCEEFYSSRIRTFWLNTVTRFLTNNDKGPIAFVSVSYAIAYSLWDEYAHNASQSNHS